MKKLFSVVAVSALLIVFCGYTPAESFNNEPIEPAMLLAQQTQESADKQLQAPREEVLDEAREDEEDEYEDEYDDEDEYADEEDVELIPDPLIELNTGIFHFNDKLYFWLLKPVARGYGFIIPEELRQAIRNVFYNIRFPVRFINCLLQGKGRKASYEFGQFFINITAGFLGLANAKN